MRLLPAPRCFDDCVSIVLLLLHDFVPAYFLPIATGYYQHTKTFPILLAQMFVVHFVRPANGSNILVVTTGKPFKPLVNNYIVYQKIGCPVHGYTKTNSGCPIRMALQTQHNTQPTGNGEDEKERIVLLKKTGAFLVMVLVEVPQKPVHYKAVGKPGYPFHTTEGKQHYGDKYKPVHTDYVIKKF
jgi:hypothetical protein